MPESPREIARSLFSNDRTDAQVLQPERSPLESPVAPSPKMAARALLGSVPKADSPSNTQPFSPPTLDTFKVAGKAALSGLNVSTYDLLANLVKAGSLLGPEATKADLQGIEQVLRKYSDDLRLTPQELEDGFGIKVADNGEIQGPLASVISYKIYNSLGGMTLTAAAGGGSIGAGFIVQGAAEGVRDAADVKDAAVGATKGAAHGFFLDRTFKLVHAAGLNPLLTNISTATVIYNDARTQGASVSDALSDAIALGIVGFGLDGRSYKASEFKAIGKKAAGVIEKATKGVDRELTDKEAIDVISGGLTEQSTGREAPPKPRPIDEPLVEPTEAARNQTDLEILGRIVKATGRNPSLQDVALERARAMGVTLENIPPAGDKQLRKLALDGAAKELSDSILTSPVRANAFARRANLFPDIDPTKVVVKADQASVFDSAAMFGEPFIFFAERIDGFKEGPMKRMFYDRHVDTMNQYFDLHQGYKDRITSLVDNLSDGQAGWLGRVLETEYDVGGLKLRGVDRLAILMMSKDPSAKPKLMKDGFENAKGERIATGLTEEQLAAIQNSATPQELAMAQMAREVFDDLYEPVAKTFARATGRTLPKIKDYYPNESDIETADPLAGHAPSMVRGFGVADEQLARDVTSKSMTKQRLPGARQVLRTDFMGTLLRHIDQASFYIARAETLQDFRDLSSHPEVIKSLQVAQGTGKKIFGRKFLDAQSFLTKWVEDVSRPGVGPTINASETAFRWLRAHSTAGILMYRVGTMVKQTASAFTAMADYSRNFEGDAKSIAAGIKTVGEDPKKWVRWAEDKFPFIKNRQQEVFLEDLRALDAKGGGPNIRKFNTSQAKLIRSGMAGIQYLDKLTITAVAHGIYFSELAKGKPEAEALRITNEVLTRTQPTAGQGDLAPIFRSGEGLRALSSFTQQINKNSNLDKETLIKVRRGDIKPSDIPGYMLFRMALPGLMIILANNAGDPRTLADKNELFAQLLSQLSGGVPIAGPILSSTIYALSQGELDLRAPRLAPAAGPSRLFRGIKSIDNNPKQAAINILSGAATTVGLPGEAGRIAIEGIEDIANGSSDLRAPFFSRTSRGVGTKKKPSTNGAIPLR